MLIRPNNKDLESPLYLEVGWYSSVQVSYTITVQGAVYHNDVAEKLRIYLKLMISFEY